jgi:hypothetical protein
MWMRDGDDHFACARPYPVGNAQKLSGNSPDLWQSIYRGGFAKIDMRFAGRTGKNDG